MKRAAPGKQSRRPEPASSPEGLPRGLLSALLDRGKLLLCLDYDGTLSEITDVPAEARPAPLVRASLKRLVRHRSQIEIAIVSGRDLDTLRELLGLRRSMWLIGTHGLEMSDRNGRRQLAPGALDFATDMECLQRWMKQQIQAKSGLVVEEKPLALALHYRSADPSVTAAVRPVLRQFVSRECPRLKILEGNMVDEILPRGIGGKGFAVRWLQESMMERPDSIAYFGDDTTDEDAFFELRRNGVTILVGPRRRSWAHYCVSGPPAVAALLLGLATKLEGGSVGRSHNGNRGAWK
jgi:trehalose 6-phosphate phosphatase